MHFPTLLNTLKRRERPSSPIAENSHRTLPTELTLEILTLALNSCPTLSARQTLLARIALLCSSARGWVQPQLYHAPELRSQLQMKRFARSVKRRAELARLVQGVRLDGMSREGEGELVGYRRKLTKGLGGVLRVCKGASRVELGNVVVFDWGDLKGLQGVTHLTLRNTLLCPRSNSLPSALPSLTHLTLSSPQFTPASAATFLTRSNLPALSEMTVEGKVLLVADGFTLRKVGGFEWIGEARELREGFASNLNYDEAVEHE